jgi:hypothetical protein
MSDAAEPEPTVEVTPPTQEELNDPSLAPALPGEGCPPPLAWSDVVREVGERRTTIDAKVNGKPVRGYAVGDGPPLYFLNGISATPDLFSLLVWLLRDDFRCVVLEYPCWRSRMPSAISSSISTRHHSARWLPCRRCWMRRSESRTPFCRDRWSA